MNENSVPRNRGEYYEQYDYDNNGNGDDHDHNHTMMIPTLFYNYEACITEIH